MLRTKIPPVSADRRKREGKNGGGDGSRTRVLQDFYQIFYMLRQFFISRRRRELSRFSDSSNHGIFLSGVAATPSRTSLLSSQSSLTGVEKTASRYYIKPRERDLVNLRLFCLTRFLARPTGHPRHANLTSTLQSKPLRPLSPLVFQAGSRI